MKKSALIASLAVALCATPTIAAEADNTATQAVNDVVETKATLNTWTPPRCEKGCDIQF